MLSFLVADVSVNIKKATNDLGHSDGIDSLNIYLEELGEVISIEVQDETANEIEMVADLDKRQLMLEFRLEKFFTFSGL
jgi:hypothetical protein